MEEGEEVDDCGDKDLFVLFASGLTKQSVNEVYTKAKARNDSILGLYQMGIRVALDLRDTI